jgi:Acetyl-coenzyme A synthetase N-terminus
LEQPKTHPEHKYIRYAGITNEENEFKNEHYENLYKQAVENKPAYFDKLAQEVHWHKPYTQVSLTPNRRRIYF